MTIQRKRKVWVCACGCGARFTPQRKNQLYATGPCKNRAAQRRWREKAQIAIAAQEAQ